MVETLDIAFTRTPESKLSEVDFNNIPFGKVYSDHMFIADFDGSSWKDLRIVPYQNLSLSPANVTLHYGQSVFEGMKAHRSPEGDVILFRPYDNFRRLNKSAERLCIPTVSEELFMGSLLELLKIDNGWVPNVQGTSLYIRPYIFATDEYIGIRPSDTYKFMIITCPVGAYYSSPVKVKIEEHYSRACDGGTGYAKAAGNYAGSLYPAKLAQNQGYQQLIWTDSNEHKYIEESGTMNLFFVLGNKVLTPKTSDSILSGITRDSVVTLAKEWGYEVEERRISVEEILSAAQNGTLSEVFGTGTAATIAQISAIAKGDQEYELPAVEGRILSNRVFAELDRYKRAEVEDKYNWLVTV